MADAPDLSRPNLRDGVAISAIASDGMLLGRVDDEKVLLTRVGDEFFAVSPRCTHYGGSLAEGVIAGDTVRCPLHHACFSLRTGEAVRAPAFDALSCWRVERQGDRVFVREKLEPVRAVPVTPTPARRLPDSVVIVGGGAAGFAAAEMLRREGYAGPVTVVSAEDDAPYDRPNLSKDYLAGDMQEDWMPLQSSDFYKEQRIELVLGARVASIDVTGRRVLFDSGETRAFGALLLATGADPIHLPIPGADDPRVHYLRSFADSRGIIDKAKTAKHAVIVGASFIGLEVAAALRERDIAVDVVAPENVPLERVMGRELGQLVRTLHESHGVVFHLGQSVARVDDGRVTLTGGATIEADVVVMGVGVRPAVSLAEKAGLTLDHGVVVDEFLETNVPGIFAAGDIARWPDPHTGQRIRVEHWVVAERQGQVAAKNMLGRRERFDAVPFFWSRHYDTSIKYVGHAEAWDNVHIDGALDAADAAGCSVTYLRAGRRLAVATVSRDRESLTAEVAMEREGTRGKGSGPG